MVRGGYEVFWGLIQWRYMVIKDPIHKEKIQQEKGQHDSTLSILAQSSSLILSPSVLYVRFWGDKDLMSFDTCVMLELMFPYF